MTWKQEMRTLGSVGGGVSLLVLLAFVVLHWLDVPAGHWLDWVIGIVSFWWLLAVVTLPWTVHFHARAVLAEGARSMTRGLDVEVDQVAWAARLARRSLLVAILLHVLSAASFGALAYTGVTPMGYVCSALALLLTGLRPGLRGLEYLQQRLATLHSDMHTPRRDAATLYELVDRLDREVREVASRLKWLEERVHKGDEARGDLGRQIERLAHHNEQAHVALDAKIDETVQMLSDDVRFIEHVRELIRFVRAA